MTAYSPSSPLPLPPSYIPSRLVASRNSRCWTTVASRLHRQTDDAYSKGREEKEASKATVHSLIDDYAIFSFPPE
ncbi:hypothetical protein FRC14_005116 [Serendipita sp. 396]|nr:hypothetical protein FRC14_005116 [Serendipita sp. 396]